MDEKNEQLPIGLDSPESAQLNELVEMLNRLVNDASAGAEMCVEDGLTALLLGSTVPTAVKMRIRNYYSNAHKLPDFNLSKLVIDEEEKFMKELLASCAKVDVTAGHEDSLRRLVRYSRGLIQAQSVGADSPEARLRTNAEALVASSPLQSLGILGYFKKLSGFPWNLDFSVTREELNAYLLKEGARLKKEKEARVKIEVEANRSAIGRQAGRVGLPGGLSRKEVPTIPKAPPDEEKTVKGQALVGPLQVNADVGKVSMEPTPVRADRGVAPEPSRVKTLVEEAPTEPPKKPPVEKTVVLHMIYDFEFKKPLEGLNPLRPEIKVGHVICCEMASGPVYEFLVTDRSEALMELKEVNGGFGGNSVYFDEGAMELGRPIKFKFIKPTDEIMRLEVRKSPTQSKNTDYVAIGDSNGNFAAYHSNLENFKVIDGNGNWIYGNKKAVIHGDILADRQMGGVDILKHIIKIRSEAEKKRGEVVVLAGNHEDFLLSVVLRRRLKAPKEAADKDGRVDPFVQCLLSNQGLGIFEMTQFTGDKIVEVNWKEVLGDRGMQDNLRKRITDALPAMRKDDLGKRLLKEMCLMKLCERIGNAIFIHTDPTNEILKTILDKKWGVEKINTRFQEILRKGLLDGEPFDPEDNFLFDTFLYTENRTFSNIFEEKDKKTGIRKRMKDENGKDMKPDLDPNLIRELKGNGINKIIFGHSDLGKSEVEGKTNRILDKEFEGFTFINVDQSAGKIKGEEPASGVKKETDSKGREKLTTGTQQRSLLEIEREENDKKNPPKP